LDLMVSLGVKRENVFVVDSKGVIYAVRRRRHRFHPSNACSQAHLGPMEAIVRITPSSAVWLG
ncbi:hypothetical protein, partial [Ralstonia pseudosolanacearum]|uniref:hypothetical protein n=1 Tax=Ralstonia pseudosolanacearum TaxID=1310165 RepID=UPI003D166CB5